MGLMDKFLGYMKLGDDEDDGYYDDEYDDYDEAPVAVSYTHLTLPTILRV